MSIAAVAGVILLAALWSARRRAKRADAVSARAVLGQRRRGALLTVAALVGAQALVGAPAMAQGFDCKQAPNPERPGSGMVGAIDPAPMGTTGQPGSAYDETGYGGEVWHTYDLGCGPQGVTNPNALVDTWVGNELFNISKNLVGATNGLHYALLSGDLMAPLDDVIATGTVALYDSVFTPWFGLAAVVLAVLLFRYIWQGDLATIGKRGMWALAGLWFASATYLTPLVYTHALDDVVITGTSSVQAGFLSEVGVDQRNTMPTLLHDQVIYRNWLRGEFGSPDAPQSQQFGRDLLRAQSWTKSEVARGEDAGSPEAKKQQFRNIANQLGSTYGYFQGIDGSRVGAGMLALLQALAFSSFQLLAKMMILLAQVLLRVLILAGPVIGLVAMLYHQVLRGIGRLAGAAMLNVVMISAMAGLHTVILTWVFNPLHGFSVLTQILLASLVTIVFLMVGTPFRRMGQMVRLTVGGDSGPASRVPSSVFSRFRGRRREERPEGGFWDRVGESGGDAERQYERSQGTGRGESRPEAENLSVPVAAQRMDRSTARERTTSERELTAGSSPSGAEAATPSRPIAGSGQQRSSTESGRTLPEARSTSRLVDTAPVADVQWAGHDDDPVLVPSRSSSASMPGPAEAPTPVRPDAEIVAGRPVDVVYRPSRGLEVSDGSDERNRMTGH